MREEIEAAALFLTRLVNKNLSNGGNGVSGANGGSTASSIHSHSSSASSSLSSASSTSSDSPPDFDEQQQASVTTTTVVTATSTGALVAATPANGEQDNKVEQFRQCLEEAMYERFHNHWFPEQPTKGQAYRCIRLNEWDRRDMSLQKACSQCGIDYKDLQLPVELTLWVDPDEVTCRFGETKGSHCLVAKFKDGELKVEQNNMNLDINNIDIEIFRQATVANERMRNHPHEHHHHHQQQHHAQTNLHGSPDYNKQHNRLNNSSGNINHNNSYQYHNNHSNSNSNSHHHHHQQQNHQSQHHHHQQQHQSSPHHHQHHQSPHRANIGKTAIFPAYHQGYANSCDTNGNPIPYYYF